MAQLKSTVRHGAISLDLLYKFARANPDIPHRKGDQSTYKSYRELVQTLIANIPQEAGWYCWYKSKPAVLPIYIGQSKKGKTSSLYARIQEELLEEYVAIWGDVYDKEPMISRLSGKYAGKYITSIRRAAQKTGAQRIVWVSSDSITEGELDVVEQKLIAAFQPAANTDIRDYSRIETEIFDQVLTVFRRYLARQLNAVHQ